MAKNLPNNEKFLKGLKTRKEVLGDDYVGKPFTGDDLRIQVHYLDRSHGWSTTKFKKLISESYEKSNNS